MVPEKNSSIQELPDQNPKEYNHTHSSTSTNEINFLDLYVQLGKMANLMSSTNEQQIFEEEVLKKNLLESYVKGLYLISIIGNDFGFGREVYDHRMLNIIEKDNKSIFACIRSSYFIKSKKISECI